MFQGSKNAFLVHIKIVFQIDWFETQMEAPVTVTLHQTGLVPHCINPVACPVLCHENIKATHQHKHPLTALVITTIPWGFVTFWQAEEEICNDALKKDLGIKRLQNYRSNISDLLSWLWQPLSTKATYNHVNHKTDLTVIHFTIMISTRNWEINENKWFKIRDYIKYANPIKLNEFSPNWK